MIILLTGNSMLCCCNVTLCLSILTFIVILLSVYCVISANGGDDDSVSMNNQMWTYFQVVHSVGCIGVNRHFQHCCAQCVQRRVCAVGFSIDTCVSLSPVTYDSTLDEESITVCPL